MGLSAYLYDFFSVVSVLSLVKKLSVVSVISVVLNIFYRLIVARANTSLSKNSPLVVSLGGKNHPSP